MSVSENYGCEIIPQLTTTLPFIQIFTIRIKFFNKYLFASSIRRPPKANFELLNTFIWRWSENLGSCEKIICRDFNLNLMKMTETSPNSSALHNSVQTLALLPFV